MAISVESDHLWMARCFDLARRGIGHVSPNPPVGAVLVYENRILGEGFHTLFGYPHAEVEAFRNVHPSERALIPKATLYVSLEPCCITGKTPPCTDLILREGVKDVRIGTQDPNPAIAGKGIQLLKTNSIRVNVGILEEEALELIRPFKINILHQRPYIVLKWAQSAYGFIGKSDEKIWLSHPYTNIWTHKKRSLVDAILVGARTVLLDDPMLTTREYYGQSPHRVIYDPHGRLTGNIAVLNKDDRKVFYFSNAINSGIEGSHVHKVVFTPGEDHVKKMLDILFANRIGALLVEGGAHMLDLFIQKNIWDEAWVIQTKHPLDHGVPAPNVRGKLLERIESSSDTIIGILNQT